MTGVVLQLADKMHFILECKAFSDIRNKKFCYRPNIFKFCELLSSSKLKTLKRLSLYVFILNIYETVCPPWLHTSYVLVPFSLLLLSMCVCVCIYVYIYILYLWQTPCINCTSCINITLVWVSKWNWNWNWLLNCKRINNYFLILINPVLYACYLCKTTSLTREDVKLYQILQNSHRIYT